MLNRLSQFVKKTIDLRRSLPKPVTIATVTALTTMISEFCITLLPESNEDPNTPPSNKKIDSSQIYLPSEKKLSLSDIPKEKFEASGRIAIQAAQDLGVTNPIFVNFFDSAIEAQASQASQEPAFFTPLPTGINLEAYSFFNNVPKRSGSIAISYDTVKKSSPEEIYALAGHEALHIQENHSAIISPILYLAYAFSKHVIKQHAPKVFYKFPMLSAAILSLNINNLINQYVIEYRADTVSANKLGSAKYLSSSLLKIDQDKQDRKELINADRNNMKPIDYLLVMSLVVMYTAVRPVPSHPSTVKRIAYLEKIQKQPGYTDKLSLFGIRHNADILITQEPNSDIKPKIGS